MPDSLPQTAGDRLYLTDGGLETTLVFHRGIDLPLFAAFPLLDSDDGRAALRDYFAPYLALAAERGTGFVLDTPTWRANADWARSSATTSRARPRQPRRGRLRAASCATRRRRARARSWSTASSGRAATATWPATLMTAEEAADYHALQAGAFAAAGADMLTAVTMTYAEEAIGIARAAAAAGLPCVISFTVETDGRLPSGQPLGEAIAAVDAATDGGPAYYMVNCAHPAHFAHVARRPGGAGAAASAGCARNASTQEPRRARRGDGARRGRSRRARGRARRAARAAAQRRPCSAAAAAPTPATSPRRAPPGPPERRPAATSS